MEQVQFLYDLVRHSLLTPAGPFFKREEYPSLVGQKWLITGATGGIGLETAKTLVEQGAEMWIVGRNTQKLADVEQQLLKINNEVKIHQVVIDYTDLTTVKPAVDQLKQQTSTLNGIIHNAGVMNVPPNSKTQQNLELTVGVNNVATQLLQNLLDPLIVNTPNGRIVWLSSLGHVLAPMNGFDLSLLSKGNSSRVYAMSKAWDYFQAVAWTRNHPQSTVKSVAVHPGIIISDLTRTTPKFMQLMMRPMMYPTTDGALPVVYAALYPEITNNDYIVPFGRSGPVRPDIYREARGANGQATLKWIEEQLQEYL